MKAKLTIHIKKIKGQNVNRELLRKVPRLEKSTEKTIKELCSYIDEYFNRHRIKSKTQFEKIEHGS